MTLDFRPPRLPDDEDGGDEHGDQNRRSEHREKNATADAEAFREGKLTPARK